MAEDLFVDSDGLRLAARDDGSGPAVALVHGQYGSRRRGRIDVVLSSLGG